MNEEVKGKKSPQLRFSGFDDEWEEKKLNEYLEPSKQKNLDNKYSKNDVLSVSGEFGIVNQIEFQGRSFAGEYVNNYGVVETNDIVYTKSPLNANPYGIIKSNFGKTGIVSTLYAVYKSKNNVDPCFIQTYFDLNKRLNDYLRPLVRKGAKNDMKVSSEDALLGNVVFPSKLEQQKIGTFLSHVDSLIQAKTKKLENLKSVKKSLLQKCFPKEGEKVPEMRFAGFSGDWEEKKLGEIGETKSGIGFPDKEQGGSEGIPFFKVSDMNSDGNEYELVVANNYVTEEQINRNNWNIVKNVPAVFFAKVGAAVMLNRKRLIRIPFLLDNNTMAYIFDKSIWDCDFGKHLFETIDLTKLTQVGALPSYNGSDVENLQIFLPPTLAEQQKIGQFFSKYDSLISLQQKEIYKLKDIKKSLLQKMFI